MEILAQQAQKIGLKLGEKEINLFEVFLKELKRANKEVNLTGITEDKDIVLKHFLDSLSVMEVLPKETETLIDVGSGAGFPGLPLKIVNEKLKVTLIEATTKKVSFLENIIQTLGLKDIKAIATRAEEAGQDLRYREQFDVVTARAVARLDILCEYALPFLKIGGIFIAQKSKGQEETTSAEKAIYTLGGKLQNIVPVKIPGLEERRLIVIEKIAPTPEKYPRRPGMPEKKPIG